MEELEQGIEQAESYHAMLVKAAETKKNGPPPVLQDVETQTYEEELETFFPGSGQPDEPAP